MPQEHRLVFGEKETTDRLPEWASKGAFMIEWLQGRGLWDEAAERLKIQREGGYAGIDMFLFLLYYFGSKLKTGLKEFSHQTRQQELGLAAIGNRKRMPTQASVSRCLKAVEEEHAYKFGEWLLREAVDMKMVLNHPSVLTYDALGEGCHLFDWDPTVTTLRRRGLPVFDGMPEGRRRSEEMAKPGYCGRKRGDVQFSRAMLQHTGSGLWLGIEVGPGNGNVREAFYKAIKQVKMTCEYAEISLERTILRADGVAGNVPFITGCIESHVHYITRLSNYKLLKNTEIIEHLDKRASWFEVQSSGSGPVRQAADLGNVLLEPANNSLKKDGCAFSPIETRVVVSRFLNSGKKKGTGIVINGWQYELYATDLQRAAWPEVEIVAGYFGRVGQENRFQQEDRELGLDRIFSYHLPGQLLATIIGLFVWNFEICRGMELANPPRERAKQLHTESTAIVDTPQLCEITQTQTDTVDQLLNEPLIRSIEPLSTTKSAGNQVIQALNTIDWTNVLRTYIGWEWLPDKGSLSCPAKAALPLMRIEQVKDRPIRARFQATLGTCDLCELRQSCFSSCDPHYRKELRIPLPFSHAKQTRAAWLESRFITKTSPHSSQQLLFRQSPENTCSVNTCELSLLQPIDVRENPINTYSENHHKSLLWKPIESKHIRSNLRVAPPTLLPAALRRLARQTISPFEIHVKVKLPPKPKLSLVLALSPASRQKRRLSWKERLRYNALPGACVKIRFLGAAAAQHLLVPKDIPGSIAMLM